MPVASASLRSARRVIYPRVLLCVAFGIPSPKSAEMHGYAVGDAYAEGRLAEILDYCRRDVEATAALLARLEPTLLPLFRR